jgi:hypothetical protein
LPRFAEKGGTLFETEGCTPEQETKRKAASWDAGLSCEQTMMFLEEVWRSKGVGRCLQSLRLGPPVDGVLTHHCPHLQVQQPSASRRERIQIEHGHRIWIIRRQPLLCDKQTNVPFTSSPMSSFPESRISKQWVMK